jgi:hypothetical protein
MILCGNFGSKRVDKLTVGSVSSEKAVKMIRRLQQCCYRGLRVFIGTDQYINAVVGAEPWQQRRALFPSQQ